MVDIPQPVRTDAAPSLPCLPSYLSPGGGSSSGGGGGGGVGSLAGEQPEAESAAGSAAEAEGALAALSPGGASKQQQQQQQQQHLARQASARNSLRFLVERCHARLPWLSCQYQSPSEAAVLRTARATGGSSAAGARAAAEQAGASAAGTVAEGAAAAAAGAAATAGPATSSVGQGVSQPAAQQAAQRGPLLLFPDTSALLSMLGASDRVAQRCGGSCSCPFRDLHSCMRCRWRNLWGKRTATWKEVPWE